MTRKSSPWRTVALLLALAGLVAACGGVDSGGTGQTVQTSSSGRIAGFGSIIVNDVRYDDSHAAVFDEEDRPRTRADLRLGMVVELDGERHGDGREGTADRIQYGHEIAGPVQSVDAANTRIVVLGQTVQVAADTIFGGYPTGLAGVQAGHLAKVFGFLDPASGTYTATLIERMPTLPSYSLRGRIANLAAAPARTFSIGGAAIDYTSVPAPSLPALANGDTVRVTLATAPAGGRWLASAIRGAQRTLPEDREAQLEGLISGLTGPASFFVAGVPVDASAPGLRVQPGGPAALVNGAQVKVKGRMRAGVLVAERIDVKPGGQQRFELHGPIDVLDTTARTLQVRGITVAWDDRTRFMAGNERQLAVGRRVAVRGTTVDGVRIVADEIRFEP